MLRTQIYLPEKLRREIDRQRASKGKSLGEYMRDAAQKEVERDKRRKEDLKILADRISNFKSTRTQKEIDDWLEEIREDRRLSDERMEKRWLEARKNSNVSSR